MKNIIIKNNTMKNNITDFRTKKLIIILMAMLITILMSSSVYAIYISGASTIQPIFETLNDLKGGLRVRAGGSGAGISDVLSEAADVGMVSRSLTDEELAKLSYRTIGLDAVVMIVNERNPVTDISKRDVQDIFTGKIETWEEFGYEQEIQLVTKEVGRSTLDLFEEYADLESPGRGGTGTEISPAAHEIGSNMEALTITGGLPGAIGYVSYGTAAQLIEAGMPVKILSLDGVEPNRQSITGGQYSMVRELNVVYTSEEGAEFVDSLNTEDFKRIVEKYGFTPVW